MQTTGLRLVDFYFNLQADFELPLNFEIMNPFTVRATRKLNEQFYNKFYNDRNSRILLLGINPGRLGAGKTGIPFTDPIKLSENLGINNQIEKKRELSSDFIYEVINTYGGPEKFYSKFILSAICPLGLLKDGNNINYYDNKDVQLVLEPFIIETLKQQIQIAGNSSIAVSIGQGKNFDFLQKLNKKYNFFQRLVSLPHPRWVMQYRLKKKNDFVNEYLKVLSDI